MELEPQVSDTNQDMIICHNCGAKLTFAPGTLSLKCEFCGALNEIKIEVMTSNGYRIPVKNQLKKRRNNNKK